MQNRYEYYSLNQPSPLLRKALVLSVLLHFFVMVAMSWSFTHKPKMIHPSVYQVQVVNAAEKAAQAEAPVPEPPPPPEPKPEPPPPPPPPKKEAPVPKPPEKKKEEKPKPIEKPKEPEKPKEEPKKEPPKKEPPKEPPKEDPKEKPKEPVTDPQPVQLITDEKPGVSIKQALPTVLGTWGGLVKRKVERAWEVPVGVRIDPLNNEAVVSFWVNRDGRLLGEPEIVLHALDPAIGNSAIEAVKAAAPFPPLPDAYSEPEVQVVYTFVPRW